MDCDIELEQIIGTALSLEDDYPESYLPIRDKLKSTPNSICGTISDLLPGAQVQVPLQNTWQQTLLDLYSLLGFPQEPKASRAMHMIENEDHQSTAALSPGIKDKPCYIRPLCEEEQSLSKKTKSEPDDLLPTLGARSRKRTIYSKEQTNFLQNQFDVNPYPDFVSRCHLAQLTGIPEPRIQVWFKNRRARHLSKIHRSHKNTVHEASILTGTQKLASHVYQEQIINIKRNLGSKFINNSRPWTLNGDVVLGSPRLQIVEWKYPSMALNRHRFAKIETGSRFSYNCK
ncbi:hypothetical protein XELAEV_18000881mg [Xenopus laevis]|nr:hypothetical protein XELAEV_18000881mg [Xenopus laevis]